MTKRDGVGINHIYLKPMNGDFNKIVLFQYILDKCEENKNNLEFIKDNKIWMCESRENIVKYFEPAFSKRTLERILCELVSEEWLYSGCFNKFFSDRTKWYRPNFEKIENLIRES